MACHHPPGAGLVDAEHLRHLFDAFVDESLRRRWLPDVTLRIRTDGTRIGVGFTAKGDAHAQVAVAHVSPGTLGRCPVRVQGPGKTIGWTLPDPPPASDDVISTQTQPRQWRLRGATMKRRTLDFMFSIGGLGLAVLLLVIGFVLTSNANFANDYVRDQLSEQNITFPALADLTDEERQADCLVAYAGQQLTTGKQAECYANEFIGLHLRSIADGATYADLGGAQTQLRARVAQAEADSDPALAGLQQELAQVTGQRETLFRGETLRGLLLTSYGFSEFGVKAGQAALVAYLAAGLLGLLAIAGFVHALLTPPSRPFAAPAPAEARERAGTAR